MADCIDVYNLSREMRRLLFSFKSMVPVPIVALMNIVVFYYSVSQL